MQQPVLLRALSRHFDTGASGVRPYPIRVGLSKPSVHGKIDELDMSSVKDKALKFLKDKGEAQPAVHLDTGLKIPVDLEWEKLIIDDKGSVAAHSKSVFIMVTPLRAGRRPTVLGKRSAETAGIAELASATHRAHISA